MSLDQINDRVGEGNVIRSRLMVGLAGVLVLMLVLGGRLAYLQVAGYQHYSDLSQQNRVRLVAVPPTRGLIYDRNGLLLAENVPAHRLVITPEQVPDMERTLDELGRIVDLRATDLERFHELRRRQRRFQEIPLKLQLTEREVARLAVDRHRFPGVEVNSHLIRHYPWGEVGVHALGYVGRISEQELQRVEASQYQGSSHIGKTGIERFYEDRLHGAVGVERVETNAMGRVLRTLEREPPTPGEDLYLTLDIRLQRVAEQALGEHSGAVVALDPRDGEVLAMASTPVFDPNLFVNGISLDDYQALQTQRDNPLFNRALRGQYPPASTLKPFVGLAGLELDHRDVDDETNCTGAYTLPNVSHRWRGWKRWGHGETNLTQAVAQSCDIYFYDLAYDLGIDAMHDFLAPFGFGAPTGIDLKGELAGVLPSRAWKKRNKGEPWYHGETIITGIGQGFTLSTPLQLASATAMLANKGDPVVPHLLDGVRPSDAASARAPERELKGGAREVSLDEPGNWQSIHASMEEVIYGERGTARRIGEDAPYRIAGKTGTAQVFGIGQDEEYDAEAIAEELRDHALFIAFAPAQTPRIAVAVIVENGGSGSGVAAPVAREVMDAWLLNYGETDAPDQ